MDLVANNFHEGDYSPRIIMENIYVSLYI